MSAALHLSAPALPGSRARAEADRWRGCRAEDWLAQCRAETRGDVDSRRARKIERGNERRARWTCAAKRIGADRAAAEVDPTAADLRVGAPQAINVANATEGRHELPDLEGLRHRDPQLWRNILRYLRGCPRARAIIWHLDAGIRREQMPALMGITQRAVNMAHATLRRRMEAMARGEPVPAGRPEAAGAEFLPAADLFAARGGATPEMPARGGATPEMPAPRKAKTRRRKAKNRSEQLDFFETGNHNHG